ncbi:hypothetical protein [Nocardia brasiliensis]|uniref:hypothetical protein n=1 Tax=Nocardia brasiliensis TaxID=37326 RepID=UPI003D8D37F0
MTVEPQTSAEAHAKYAVPQPGTYTDTVGQDAPLLRLVTEDVIGAADAAVQRYLGAADADDPVAHIPALQLVPAAAGADVPADADVLAAADAAVERYFAAADADNTVRAYGSAWRGFIAWCAELELRALPADPLTVARYLAASADARGRGRDPERGLSASTLVVWRAAISHAHTTAGLPDPSTDPVVVRVMAGIAVERTDAGHTPNQAPAATLPVLQDLVTAIHTTACGATATWRDQVAARRDIAAAVLLYAAALRRSEATALILGDLELAESPDGDQLLRIRLRGSKTHRAAITYKYRRRGRGDAVWCPWCALLRWIEILTVHDDAVREARKYLRDNNIDDNELITDAASVAVQRFLAADHSDPHQHRCAITEWPGRHRRAPLLRPLSHGGLPRRAALTDRSLARTLSQHADAAGVGPLRGHSFRAGAATQAFDSGATVEQVMALTGHKRMETALRYDRRREQRSADTDTGL